MRTALLGLCFSLSLLSCSKRTLPHPAAEPLTTDTRVSPTSGTVSGIAPCDLLSRSEVESIQGEPIVETRPSERSDGGLTVSQCYFGLTTNANSIILSVTRKGSGAGARDPREFWEATFREKEGGEKEREHEEKSPPRKIDGLGEEAFWTGSGIGGALYVLMGDAFLRLGIGGAGDQEAKIDRSKRLAEFALRRWKAASSSGEIDVPAKAEHGQ